MDSSSRFSTRRSFIKKMVTASTLTPVLFSQTLKGGISVPVECKKVLLDTDIGNDPDDAACLAYLCLQEKCDLLGVTTVGKRSHIRAQLADSICLSLGRTDVPIAAGASDPLFANLYWWDHHVYQERYLEKYPPRNQYQPGEAVAFMQEKIRQYPGEVTLLCVGPLTNAAALWAAYPEVYGLLKEIVIMGGSFRDEPRYDANFMMDAIAAGTILERREIPLRAAGVEETGPLSVHNNKVKEWFAEKRYKPLLDFFTGVPWMESTQPKWLRDQKLGMHDPFAASIIFNDNLCDYLRVHARVNITDYVIEKKKDVATNEVSGYVSYEPDKHGPHLIARNARKQALHDHLAETWKSFSCDE